MFGSRRITSRILVFFLFASIIFLYFYINILPNVAMSNVSKDNSPRNTKKTAPKRTHVDLVVVEEHHEVLEYWFDAANKGKIPKSGNVLVHIDAHSDMAPPELIDNYPLFSWPKNKHQMKAMMQSNDAFIQGAAMSGLFKKVIWVWPSWDEETHEEDDVTHIFGAGLAVLDTNAREETFCECEYSEDRKTKRACQFLNRTKFSEQPDYEGDQVDPKRCVIKGNINYQQIVDYNALHKLQLGQLVQEGETLLLDIDQDFFGCVLRGHDLVNAGIPWSTVEELDELLNEIFCPRFTQNEGIANDFMQVILALVIKHCKSSPDATIACITPGNPRSKEFSAEINRIIRGHHAKGIFCDMSRDVRQRALEMLIENFVQLKEHQIRACADLGFCMQTSPRSYQANGFQICHGANDPNSTVVTQHLPGENELTLRLKRLRRMLSADRYPTPKMVTLCRSVRDGYTSVEHFESIEENVIEAIKHSRKDVTFNVIYDINLLGGKKGWPSRQRG